MNPNNLINIIGNTPLVTLKNIDPSCQLFGKLEHLNPSGSTKDRMALHIIEKAEKTGLLAQNSTIVENSSGNTGIAMAMIAGIKGYKCIITMPDKMSKEKQDIIKSYGAKVVVTRTDVAWDSDESYYSLAKKIAQGTPHSYYPDQYNNLWNIEAHYLSTGPEIWRQTEGKIDMLIAGIGTGGTLSGAGRYLKEQNSKIKIIAVDPIGSVFYDYFNTRTIPTPHMYEVEGIGEDYLVKAVDFSLIDEIYQVNDFECFNTARNLCKTEGIFAGGSSGAVISVALKIIKKFSTEHKNDEHKKQVVCIFPDSGNRYISKFYNDQWMKEQGYEIE